MAFIRLTTNDGMGYGIIRNRGTESTNETSVEVNAVVIKTTDIPCDLPQVSLDDVDGTSETPDISNAPYLGERVKFTYENVPCEGEITQIFLGTSPISYLVRVFACSDYSVLSNGNECTITAADIVGLQPLGWSS